MMGDGDGHAEALIAEEQHSEIVRQVAADDNLTRAGLVRIATETHGLDYFESFVCGNFGKDRLGPILEWVRRFGEIGAAIESEDWEGF